MMGSIVIPNWNGCDVLRKALAGVRRLEVKEPLEVIVVDNGSTDGSREMTAKEFGFSTWQGLQFLADADTKTKAAKRVKTIMLASRIR